MTANHPHPRALVLDTDIGSDVDDALALGVLLGSPEVDLVGITTVYGDTLLRARLAHRLAALAGHAPTVVPGAAETLSGKEVWWPGHEGTCFDDLHTEPVRDDLNAADFLAETVRARPGEVDVMAIGPLANLAQTLQRHEDFAEAVGTVYLMGGFFGPDAKPEHNILSDVAAARTVFEAGLPMVVSGLETTTRFRVESDGIEAIRAAGPYGTALAREIDTWIEFKSRTWTTPHDPITALSMLRPDLYTFERGHVTVEDDGLTVFHADPAGPVRLVTDADLPAVAEQIVARIVRAGAGA
ncbi:nucleoside hydrolase [Streptomyces sp. BB1-1-1]|uniref:nucleoside hydrolase n=1 Tax=Streptomyces sp. BB1-1-1 TaxID=3074430 RepID=UPI002877E328|nr:nucleoside hydrolase [Streptomyces sp. BB1-1-1]WND39716.1 nucleoside hydrolase [Streptomyces sp. BB1-1-1]